MSEEITTKPEPRITGVELAAAINAAVEVWRRSSGSKTFSDAALEVRAAVLLLRGPALDAESEREIRDLKDQLARERTAREAAEQFVARVVSRVGT